MDRVISFRVNVPPLAPVALFDSRAIIIAECGKGFFGLRDAAILLALLEMPSYARRFLALDMADVDARIQAGLESPSSKIRT